MGEVIFSLVVCAALDRALLIRFKGLTSVGLEVEAVVDVVGVFLAADVVIIVEVELVVVLPVVLELLVVEVVAVVRLVVGYTI